MTGREAMAAALVAFAAGPTVVAILKCFEAASSTHGDLWSAMDAATFALSTIFGLVGGIPAAVAGLIVARMLMRKEMDAAWVAIVVGSAIGAVLAIPCYIFAGSDAFVLSIAAWMASVILSLIYWLIAVRPHRHWRLTHRDAEAIRAME
jgi:hypothetical protein